MRAFLVLALFAASLAVGFSTYTTGATAAGHCESVPPSKKFQCCQKHPRAPACR